MRALLLAGAVSTLSLAGFPFVGGPAHAAVIGFDDLASNVNKTISNGYSGLNWNNVYAVKGSNEVDGFQAGVVSPSNVAFNGYGTLGTVSSATPFTLNSGYFTAAYYKEAVTVLGYVNGVQTYSSTFTALTTAPTLETFNWSGLSSFTFVGGNQINSQVVIDDLTVSQAVPEPASLALLGMGVAGVAAARRRRAA